MKYVTNEENRPATILVSQAEAARLLSVERTMIWRLVKRGDIQQIHLGRRALIVRSSLDDLVTRMTSSL